MTPALLRELQLTLRILAEEYNLPLAARWIREQIPAAVSDEDRRIHELAREIAPSLSWPSLSPTREVYADIGQSPSHTLDGAFLLVNDEAVAFIVGGLKWRIKHRWVGSFVAEDLHARGVDYLRRWREPENPGRREFMRHRREAVEALVRAVERES